MLVSLNWLQEYVDISDYDPENLAELITKSGIEVDAIHYITKEPSEKVVVGHVLTCEKHPNADKLNLCQVDVGEEKLQIICGAANVAQGQKVAVATPGAVLPGNFKIKKVKLRGVESNGMICSLAELGIQEQFINPNYAEGIVVLPDEAEVGQAVQDLLNLDDVVLEFDLTPNRADALSMIGVAYEVAAILDRELHLPEPKLETIGEEVDEYISVQVEDEHLCPYYGAFVIKDIEVKAAPFWMQNYLLAAGVRPINNVVDITNYVLLEYGQPLHAFDYDLLDSKEILVRKAKAGETIVTLDEETRTLSQDDLLITNGKKGIALAGVMGGKNTEVSGDTTTVLLEAALFDPFTIRKTVNATGLRSDASTRFEKGVDPNRVREAGIRACELLLTYANGKVVRGIAEFDRLKMDEKQIRVDANEVNKRLGSNLSIEEIGDIFRKLSFEYKLEGEVFTVTVPSRRGDLSIFEDMLEEIARIYGYDHLAFTMPENPSKAGQLTSKQKLTRRIKEYLQGVGMSEAITYSLTNKHEVGKYLSPELTGSYQPVSLAMPLSEDHQYLRLSLLPELLNRLAYNVARKQKDVAFYEVGSVFLSEEEELTNQPKEHLRLAGAITGTWLNHPWQEEVKAVDFYTVKGIVEGLFRYINVKESYEAAQIEGMHPGRCAIIQVDGEVLGFLGQIHPSVAKEKDLKESYVFDLNLERILELERHALAYQLVPKYPSIIRDVAFVVKDEIHAGHLKAEMESIGRPLVKAVEVFDLYQGDRVGEDEKSIAFTIHFEDPEKTLTDEEVDACFNEIIEAVNKRFNAYIRK